MQPQEGSHFSEAELRMRDVPKQELGDERRTGGRGHAAKVFRAAPW